MGRRSAAAGRHRTVGRRTSWARRAAVGGVVVALGLAGAGTASALWSDHEQVAGQIGTGAVSFAAGRATGGGALTTATGPDDVLAVTLGRAEAEALVSRGRLAVPLRVDSLAQGNLGLRYTVELPARDAGTILGAADLVLVPVASPAACTPRETLPAAVATTSTPVPATYSAATTPTTQYWCLLGRLAEPPVVGSYTNTGTVRASSAYGSVTASDTWTADVQARPADEPSVEIRFTHETFRPER
jgi:hypothetical protein